MLDPVLNTGSLYYIRDFAKTCEQISTEEMSDIAPKIIDVLPYVLDCTFGLDCKIQKENAQKFLSEGVFESALIALIPHEMIVASSMAYPWTFTFSDLELANAQYSSPENLACQRTYKTTANAYSLGMLCSFLRFLCDAKEIVDIGQKQKKFPDYLKLMK
ncbi:hypothetical protein [Novosphingobium sp.]|uniref:hypothetical protein n=1 Tax=Novosphingobium sp. TaxID=1874826 RepID=UPI00262B4035|nr:hypothetical protein [Novosphingobium sp.]